MVGFQEWSPKCIICTDSVADLSFCEETLETVKHSQLLPGGERKGWADSRIKYKANGFPAVLKLAGFSVESY